MNFFARFVMDNFPVRLRELRKKKGLLQKDIAKLLEITERQYIRYEAGEVDPPMSKVKKLKDFYNVTLDYIMGD